METGDKPQGLMAKLWACTTPPTPEQRQQRQEDIKRFEEWKANYPKVDARRAELIAQMKEAERDFLLYLETHEDDRYFDEHQSHYVGVTEQCEDELFEITKPYWEPDEPEAWVKWVEGRLGIKHFLEILGPDHLARILETLIDKDDPTNAGHYANVMRRLVNELTFQLRQMVQLPVHIAPLEMDRRLALLLLGKKEEAKGDE